jgi:glycosyltransferase involved in cell wall biosynthesis
MVPIFSNSNLPPEGIMKLLSDADIGFVSYKASDENFANITWASGQIAEHTRARLPVIAHGDTSLNDFVKEYNIGIGIKDMRELSDAIKKIKSDYEGYSRRSRKLFDEKMNISKYIPFNFN